MKRLLGITLVLTMVFAMLPAVGATETEITPTYEYVFTRAATGVTSDATSDFYIHNLAEKGIESVDAVSSGKWAPKGRLSGSGYLFLEKGYRYSVKDTATGDDHLLGANGSLFEISVKEDGTFIPSIDYYTYASGSQVNLYLCKQSLETAASTYIKNTINGSFDEDLVFFGTFNTHVSKAKEFEDKKQKVYENNAIQLKKDTKYYLVVAIDGANSPNDSSYDTTPLFFCQLYSFGLTKVESQPEEDATVTKAVSFVATSNVGTNDMMQVSGFDYDKFIDEIPAGTYVTVTAPEKDGYEFKHWLRGSRDTGVYISNESSYSFTALTNTFLTAIYEEAAAADGSRAVVEFYNGNGQYIERAEATLGETVALPQNAPELTGFVFANEWKSEDGIFTSATTLTRMLTRAVAQFEVIDTTFDVTDKRDGSVYKLSYGKEKTFTSEKPVCWLRDDTVVAYGTSYTYAAWDNAEIDISESGELEPVVLLDGDAKDGARMIEYNAAGKNVIEVGLIFGSVKNITIDSCNSKATSQYKNQHGQFTAKPNSDEAFARGYLIYEEDGVYKVVYSK